MLPSTKAPDSGDRRGFFFLSSLLVRALSVGIRFVPIRWQFNEFVSFVEGDPTVREGFSTKGLDYPSTGASLSG